MRMARADHYPQTLPNSVGYSPGNDVSRGRTRM